MTSTDPAPTGLETLPVEGKASRRKAVIGRTIGWSAVLLAGTLGVAIFHWSEHHPRSDDGKISAAVIGIAPRVSGPIRSLPIRDNQLVRAGDVLFQIDPEPYELAAQVAKANVEAISGELKNALRAIEVQRLQIRTAAGALAKAQALLAETTETYNRLAPLLAKRYASPEQGDTARRAKEGAAASVEITAAELAAAAVAVQDASPLQSRQRAAEAELAQAELAVRDCTVLAPFDGRVAGMNLSVGAFARVAVDVLTFIDTRQWYVLAKFREGELASIHPGDKVRVELMTSPGRIFFGEVESLGWGVTALPQDPFPGLPIVMRELDWVRLALHGGINGMGLRVAADRPLVRDILRRIFSYARGRRAAGDPGAAGYRGAAGLCVRRLA